MANPYSGASTSIGVEGFSGFKFEAIPHRKVLAALRLKVVREFSEVSPGKHKRPGALMNIRPPTYRTYPHTIIRQPTLSCHIKNPLPTTPENQLVKVSPLKIDLINSGSESPKNAALIITPLLSL